MPSNRNAEKISRFVNCEEYNGGNKQEAVTKEGDLPRKDREVFWEEGTTKLRPEGK